MDHKQGIDRSQLFMMNGYNLSRLMRIFDLKTLKSRLNKLVFDRIIRVFKAINNGFLIDKIVKRTEKHTFELVLTRPGEIKNKSALLVPIRS